MSEPSSADVHPAPGEGARGWLSTVGWACYLACSWTWCIGMFLPVLLVRDYGLWGFVVFAVPNVVGAAAMGWVIRDRSTSGTLVARNAAAVRAFSRITIAFQVAFVGWLTFSITPRSLTLLAVGSFAAVILGSVARRSVLWVAMGSLAISVVCACIFVRRAGFESVWTPAGPGGTLAPVSAVCAFGFMLCPYLDPTFHATRQSLLRTSAWAAFGIGFGVLFAAMIVFTLLYSRLMMHDDLGVFPGLAASAALPVVVHVLTRVGYVVAVHEIALTGIDRALQRRGSPLWLLLLTTVPFLLGWFSLTLPPYGKLPAPEVLYRLFMSFYGLVFPAYVWLCMIPTRAGHSGIDGPIGRRKLIVWAVAVALAAPAFWMGFIEREEWWLCPGLGVVLLARLLIPGGWGFGRLPPEPSGAPVPAPTHPPTLAAHATPGPHPGVA